MGIKPKDLFQALDFRLSEVLKLDLLVGIVTGAGGLWLALQHPRDLNEVVGPALGVVGVIIGAVIAGAAILGAFLDQAFLRKLKRIKNGDPVRYFAPFFFTAFMGVLGILFLLVLMAMPDGTPAWIRATIAGFGGLTTGWTIGSLVYDLDVLVQFLRLQETAANVPDQVPEEAEGEVRRLPRNP